MNIDLKGFTESFYRDLLGGSLSQVMHFIEKAVETAHVELTTLIIPGENDSEEAMREESRWIAGLRNPDGETVPLHVSRFFPRFHMTDRGPTEVEKVYRLAEVAREVLPYVYVGNC
jgi:pyruvate formate lyase activating enzyme